MKGEVLEDLGVQSLPGEEVQVYSTAGIPREGDLAFRISGRIDGSGGLAASLPRNQLIAYGAGIAGVLMLDVGIGLYLRGRSGAGRDRSEPGITTSREEILDSIIALEDLYQNGEISQESFEKKRDALKAQLSDAAEQEG